MEIVFKHLAERRRLDSIDRRRRQEGANQSRRQLEFERPGEPGNGIDIPRRNAGQGDSPTLDLDNRRALQPVFAEPPAEPGRPPRPERQRRARHRAPTAPAGRHDPVQRQIERIGIVRQLCRPAGKTRQQPGDQPVFGLDEFCCRDFEPGWAGAVGTVAATLQHPRDA